MIQSIFSTMPMFVCLFWGLVLASSFRSLDRARKYMMLFMFVSSALYFCHCAFFNNETRILPVTEHLYPYLNLAVFPLFYVYISALTSKRPIRLSYFWLFMPTIVLGTILLFDIPWREILERIISAVFVIQVIFVIMAGYRMISLYNTSLNDYYSNTEGKEVKHLQVFLVFFLCTALLALVVNHFGRHFFVTRYIFIIPSALFSILLFLLGLICSKQTFTVIDFNKEVEESDKKLSRDEKSIELDEHAKFGHRIVHVITSEHLYLHPDFKVSDLANIMSTNRTYIYQAIKKDLNTNFSDLINHYRVQYARKLIDKQAQEGQINISEIIETSGFTSESSFYRIIKKNTGTSPQKLFLACTKNKEYKEGKGGHDADDIA